MLGTQQHLITNTERDRTMLSVIRPLLIHLSPLHCLLRTSQCVIQFRYPLLSQLNLMLTAHMISRNLNSSTINQLKRSLASSNRQTIVNCKLTLAYNINPSRLILHNERSQHLFQRSMLPFSLPVTLGVVSSAESQASTYYFHQRGPKS